jgi:phage gp36-like protein
MAYAAIQDLVARYGEAELIRLAGDATQDSGSYDVNRVNLILEDASSEIDSYVRRRYATPVSPVSQELVRATCVLARYELAQGDGRDPTPQMVQSRKDILAWLKDIGDGAVFLSAATGNAMQQGRTRPVYGDSTQPAGPGADSALYPGPEFWSGPL